MKLAFEPAIIKHNFEISLTLSTELALTITCFFVPTKDAKAVFKSSSRVFGISLATTGLEKKLIFSSLSDSLAKSYKSSRVESLNSSVCRSLTVGVAPPVPK